MRGYERFLLSFMKMEQRVYNDAVIKLHLIQRGVIPDHFFFI